MIENLQEISELKARYNYSVAKGVGKWLRRTRLIWGVQDFGLFYVAHLVSGHVRLRVEQHNERWEECIEKWMSDLEWLKERYYCGKEHPWCWQCVMDGPYFEMHSEERHSAVWVLSYDRQIIRIVEPRMVRWDRISN